MKKPTPEEKFLAGIFGRAISEEEISEEQRVQMQQTIAKALKFLDYRAREIIKMRFGLGDGCTYTLEEVGHAFKVTRERIRQVERRALERLRKLPFPE